MLGIDEQLTTLKEQYKHSCEGLESFKEWIDNLAKENGKSNSIVGMEPTGHYWFNLGYFLKEEGIRLVLVNPFHVKRSKELDDNSPTKNDRKDPRTIAKLVIDGRYSVPYIPEGIYSDLRVIMDIRDSINKSLTKIKNRVIKWLDKYFPEFFDVFADWEGKAALITLREFPIPEKIIAAGIDNIVTAWRVENSSGKHKGQTTISKRGRSRLRNIMFKVVMPLVAKNNEFKMLHKHYTTRRKNPLKKKQSLILLCCKLIRIFYALITKRVAYSPERLLKNISYLQLQDAA